VGHLAEHASFVVVHGGLGWSDGTAGAGFDLDEAEGVALPCHEIKVSARTGGAPAPGGDDESPSAKVEVSSTFAAAARGEMRGPGTAALGGTVETIEEVLKAAEA